MRQFRILFATGVVLLGLIRSLEAQQQSPSSQPATETVANSTETPNLGTLKTTVVETEKPPFRMYRTTGSFRGNTEAAKVYQEEALQKARIQKSLKGQVASIGDTRMTYVSKADAEFLQKNPNPPTSMLEPSATSSPLNQDSGSSDNLPPEGSVDYVKIRGGGGGTLSGRIRAMKGRNSTGDSTVATLSDTPSPGDAGNSSAGPPPGSNVPLPPGGIFRPSFVDRDGLYSSTDAPYNPGPPPEGTIFRSGSSERPSAPTPPSSAPSSPAPTPPGVPTFAELDRSEGSAAMMSPPSQKPKKKSLFSFLSGKKKQTPEPVSVPASTYEPTDPDAMAPAQPAAIEEPTITFDPSIDPATPEDIPSTGPGLVSVAPEPGNQKNGLKALFSKSGSGSSGTRSSSGKQQVGVPVVTEDTIFVMVNGRSTKMPPGTRLRVLKEGTYRTLVVLPNGSQGSVENGVLNLGGDSPLPQW